MENTSPNKVPIIKCDKCGKTILLMQINLAQAEVEFVESHVKLLLTRFKCPFCGVIYPVQLDNEATLLLLKEERMLTARYKGMKVKHREKYEKLFEKIRKIQMRLASQRNHLILEYNGQVYQFSSGETITKEKLEYMRPTAYVGCVQKGEK